MHVLVAASTDTKKKASHRMIAAVNLIATWRLTFDAAMVLAPALEGIQKMLMQTTRMKNTLCAVVTTVTKTDLHLFEKIPGVMRWQILHNAKLRKHSRKLLLYVIWMGDACVQEQ